MPPTPKRRMAGTSIPDDVAARLLSDHIPAAGITDASKIFPYGVGLEQTIWKKSARWDELWRHRAFLEDIAEASKGKVLLHSTWFVQIKAFLKDKAPTIAEKDALKIAYRSRAMLAHLRDTRREGKAIPMRYQKMQTIVDSMVLEAPGDLDEREEGQEEYNSSAIVQTSTHQPAARCSKADSDLSDFEVFRKDSASTSVSSAKNSKATPSRKRLDTITISDSDVDDGSPKDKYFKGSPLAVRTGLQELVRAASEIVPLDPRTGDKRVGWKRPAAAPEETDPALKERDSALDETDTAPMEDPALEELDEEIDGTTPEPSRRSQAKATTEKAKVPAKQPANKKAKKDPKENAEKVFKSSLRRRLHSKAYHRELLRCKTTMSEEEATKRAVIAGNSAAVGH